MYLIWYIYVIGNESKHMFWHPRVNSNLMISHVKLQMITVLFENHLKCSDIHENHENLFSETSETSQNIFDVKSTSNDIISGCYVPISFHQSSRIFFLSKPGDTFPQVYIWCRQYCKC